MEEKKQYVMEENVQKNLQQLLAKLQDNVVVKEYQQIEQRVQNHQGLHQLAEEIREQQQQAVKFAHYGQTEAEKISLQKADKLTAQFDEHPLVVTYREKLIEANDLLQHLTHLLEKQVNQGLENLIEKQSETE